MRYLVDVLVEYQNIEQVFTYHSDMQLQKNVRVKIAFNHKEIIGFVVEVYPYKTLDFITQPILSVIDDEPIITDELSQLANWMANQYFTTKISALFQILPKKLQPKSNAKAPNLEAWVKIKNRQVKTKKQQEAIDFLQEDKLKTIFLKQFKSVATKLIKDNFVEVYYQEKKGNPILLQQNQTVNLTTQQQNAVQRILSLNNETALLHGVTASGKSEVFFSVIKNVLNQNKQVLLLVPEISLVSQMVKFLLHRFEGNVTLYHSNLNEQEKYECFQMVKNQQVNIVVGTRSAIFLPFSDLGLIIIDEEHDGSYKQDKGVLYDTIEIAEFRKQYHNCALVLASATPSVNSYARAYKKRYVLIEMTQKVFNVQREIVLIDMKKESRKNDYILSKQLIQEIKNTLLRSEQVVLILNKRGYANYVKCLNCGHVEKCDNCDVALKYHHNHRYLCHICDFSKEMVNHCLNCGSELLTYQGVGTQKLAEYVAKLFPEYKIARIDKDSTTKKNSLTTMLEQFENGEYHILIGTQMLSKGLDFSNVTLVGMVNGDDLLSRESFQSVETMYQFLVQSFGRSARKKPGKVYLQVYDTQHYAIQSAIEENYKKFFVEEMAYRHLGSYPPYVYLTSIVIQNYNVEKLTEDVAYFVRLLKDMSYLGPHELYRIKNLYRQRLIFKTKDQQLLLQQLHEVVKLYRQQRRSTLIVDFNCQSL